MKSSHYEISLQRGAAHMLQAFLKSLLLVFIIVLAPGCQGLLIHVAQDKTLGQKEFLLALIERNILLCFHT